MGRDRLFGALLVALSASAFGAMAIFARVAYADGADPVAVLFLRFSLAAALLVAYMFASRRRWPRGRNLIALLVMGGVCYVGQSLSFFVALNHATAGLVALLLYLYPFMVTVLSALILHRRLTLGRTAAVVIALGGTALMLWGGMSGAPLGVALGVGAALIYSIYIMIGGLVLSNEEPLASATVVMLAAALVFGAIAAATRPAIPASLSGWVAVAAIAVISTVIAMVSLFAGIRRLGAADAATLSTLEPVVTFVLAALFLGESLRANQVIGGAVVLAAVIWLTRSGANSGPASADEEDYSASGVGRNSVS